MEPRCIAASFEFNGQTEPQFSLNLCHKPLAQKWQQQQLLISYTESCCLCVSECVFVFECRCKWDKRKIKKEIIKQVISGSSLFNAFLANVLLYSCVCLCSCMLCLDCPSLSCTIRKSVNEIAKFNTIHDSQCVCAFRILIEVYTRCFQSYIKKHTNVKKIYWAPQLFYLFMYTSSHIMWLNVTKN